MVGVKENGDFTDVGLGFGAHTINTVLKIASGMYLFRLNLAMSTTNVV